MERRCRKCWQLLSPFDPRCAHCGDVDAGHVYDAAGEWLIYSVVCAAVVFAYFMLK
jgi:uncharacterized OB-fold protein